MAKGVQVPPPKRPLSAFFLFKDERYPIVKAANGDMKIAEITKIIAGEWRQQTDASKKTYQDRTDAAKKVYDQTMKEYIAQYGKPVRTPKKIRKGKGDKAEKKSKKERKPKGEKKKAKRAKKDKTNGAPKEKAE
ncbi:MAG: hypothetical protein IM572_04825 [Chitinophagaceae bacterium]|nr:hypothetical protein [Chitinophagaceae bacterium]